MNADQWSRVKELFHATLERAPHDRTAFLKKACASDDALRSEVERLLVAHTEAGTSFIEAAPASIPPSTEPLAQITGRTLGHYRVGRLIGVGGMGVVYEAHDLELERVVALKVVIGDDRQAQSRLRREAQQASQLNHPHICTIYEVGEAGVQAYFAMEYVEGQTLSQSIASTALPLEAALRYGIQIADALSHAHRRGVIHRDLKSTNVMVTEQGCAKVLDFGLACAAPDARLKEVSQSNASLVGEGLIAGTLPYMSPEVLSGEPADVRKASGHWASCCMRWQRAGVRSMEQPASN